ncbi:MAG: indole-3-glycerol phosphate synthase TrpC [Gammaproteobacteria bacterium]|nr:indole-3-glycerol phosphate synthase TrpC [Gammaproteobacteria bacterium]
MSDFLQTMATSSAARAAAAGSFSASDFDKPVVPLSLGSFDVIAEIKDRSPAVGELSVAGDDRASRAAKYAAGGAAAVSVLTEPSRFDGSLQHLADVAAAVPDTPVMRKDFLVEPVQILEARKAGASGVLLIAAMLSDDKLRTMLDCAWEYGLFVLLESFDEDDLRRSSALLDESVDADRAEQGQLLFGVNTRNLRTLEVDSDRLRNLAARLPRGRCVAESGLLVPADAERVAGWGYTMALVGTALMRSEDPESLVAAMRKAGSR